MKRTLKWSACGILVIVFTGIAYAQFAKPQDAIKYRQSAMVILAHHFGQIAAVVQGRKPFDAKEVEKNASLVDTMAKLSWDAFMVPGAEKGNTRLNASAFSKDKAGFTKDAEALMAETAKLMQASTGGNLDSVKARFGAVGKSCKACHVNYRSR